MIDQRMVNYIRSSLSQGYSADSVRQALAQQGWVQQQINEAFAEAQGGQAAGAAATHQLGTRGERTNGVTVICALGFLSSAIAIFSSLYLLVSTSALLYGFEMVFGVNGLWTLSFLFLLPLLVGIVGFVSFYLLFKMKRTGLIMVYILGTISLASSVLGLNILNAIIWAVILVYISKNRHLFV
jgi:hypothetical protein